MLVCCSGDTDSSSDFEAIPTMGGLRFQDTPSPTGSEFNTPAPSVASDEDDPPYGAAQASLTGPFQAGPQGSHPVQLQGPVFQVWLTSGSSSSSV